MRREKHRAMVATFLLTMLGGAASVCAQERAPKPPPKGADEDVVIFERHIAPPPGEHTQIEVLQGRGGRGPGDTFVFVSTEMSFGSKLVKNAPYSAQATTETTQALADGNRIVRKNTASVYRDSEGRTRHDQSLGSIGPWAADGEPKQTSFINDPVGRVHYVLDPRSRIARKMMLPPMPPTPDKPGAPPAAPPAPREGRPADVFRVITAPPPPEMRSRDMRSLPLPKPKIESLGKQNIEGVEAEGTRDTITIPAGEIGNEQPIQIVSERWYSPELQTIVLSRHSDPRFGETVFRLTGINRGEPARNLFEVPSDYTIKEGPSHMRTIRRKFEDKKPNEEK